jgi:cell division protein FtsX
MPDSTKHFDAPRPSGSAASVVALVRSHAGVFVALLVVTTVVLFATLAIPIADALVAAMLAQAIEATPVVAILDRETPAAGAEALGARIRGLSGVAGATWRGKDDALKALVAKGLPPPEGRNPLPDIWALRIDAGAVLKQPETLEQRVDETRRALKALPGIDATRVDDRWVTALDERIGDWKRVRVGAAVVGFLILAVLAASGGFLAGRTLSGENAESARRVSVVALIVVLESMGGFLFVMAAAALADLRWNVQGSPLLQRVFEQPIVDDRVLAATALVAILAVLGVAFAWGAHRR